MTVFDPTTSDLAGISPATLTQWLTEAQTALHNLSIGGQAFTVQYAQGDGSKSVTYTRANIASLRAHIVALKAQLGIIPSRGGPIRFRY